MSDYIDNQGFRANVGIVLMRDGGELFLGGRRDGRGWQFPQGGVQRNEQPEDALYRELHEEIGLERRDVELVAGTSRWLRYRLPHQYVRRRGTPLCIGQKQRWYLLRMLSDDSRLNFEATARTRVRPGALGRLLGPGPRSHLFQARGLCSGAAGTGRAGLHLRSAAATGLDDRRNAAHAASTVAAAPTSDEQWPRDCRR